MIVSLLDVNMLIALLDEQHIHHSYIHRWLSESPGEFYWATCPLTINGFVRIFGSAQYREGPGTLEAAATILDQACSVAHHEFWPDDLSLLDADIFRRRAIPGSNGITDVYLLALAVRHNGRLVTFDRSITLDAVVGAEPRHLVCLP